MENVYIKFEINVKYCYKETKQLIEIDPAIKDYILTEINHELPKALKCVGFDKFESNIMEEHSGSWIVILGITLLGAATQLKHYPAYRKGVKELYNDIKLIKSIITRKLKLLGNQIEKDKHLPVQWVGSVKIKDIKPYLSILHRRVDLPFTFLYILFCCVFISGFLIAWILF